MGIYSVKETFFFFSEVPKVDLSGFGNELFKYTEHVIFRRGHALS